MSPALLLGLVAVAVPGNTTAQHPTPRLAPPHLLAKFDVSAGTVQVLEPLLGFELARERANNIAQVLAMAEHDPERVALDMLRRTGLGDVAGVAEQVSHAWSAGVRAMERVA